jgi:redox-sensing transcriptional repressor
MVAAGITSILNFAPAVLQVPKHISLRKVDLSIELQILSFYEQRKVAQEAVLRGTTRRRLAEVEGSADPGL